MKKKLPRMIYLEWADALANPNWFNAQSALDWCEDSNWNVKMCGWLIKETDKYIVCALQWKAEDEWTEEKFCNLHKIPKTWIKNRKYLD